MYKLVLVTFLVASVAILEIACMDTMVAPPPRPAEFRSPNELRSYLKALNEYYAIVGRPRFGKRNGAARSPDFFRPNGDASAAEEGQGWSEYL
ncbi:neuropeptide y [Plakobranchus ocellatus]|uniref:Neuropeptide y n=1 Tax=Plakobranchus ocellatus TaxID=259542 RepID=A0AAV4D5M6_9GAST|nr:neuropeptide y [Plakobranchus ocellatus]